MRIGRMVGPFCVQRRQRKLERFFLLKHMLKEFRAINLAVTAPLKALSGSPLLRVPKIFSSPLEQNFFRS